MDTDTFIVGWRKNETFFAAMYETLGVSAFNARNTRQRSAIDPDPWVLVKEEGIQTSAT